MQCPNCTRSIDESLFSASLTFCPYCGQNLKPNGQENGRLAFCSHCGREQFAQTNFCPHCGKQLKVSEKRFSGHKVGKAFLEQVAQPIIKVARDAFSSEKKTRKLFKQWSEYAELPLKEIPSMEALRETPEIGQAKRSPRWYLAVGIVALIAIVLVIILVIQC